MQGVMIDLETLGTVPGCCILSIGAVPFSGKGVGEEGFYQTVLTSSCEDLFLTRSESTVEWWKKQSPEARKVFDDCGDPERSMPLAAALERFNEFLINYGGRRDVRVWGNGADFDNAILQVCYDVAGVPPGWRFTNNRCYRTLKNMRPWREPNLTPEIARTGTYHNALDDARSQAEHAVAIMRRLQCVPN